MGGRAQQWAGGVKSGVVTLASEQVEVVLLLLPPHRRFPQGSLRSLEAPSLRSFDALGPDARIFLADAPLLLLLGLSPGAGFLAVALLLLLLGLSLGAGFVADAPLLLLLGLSLGAGVGAEALVLREEVGSPGIRPRGRFSPWSLHIRPCAMSRTARVTFSTPPPIKSTSIAVDRRKKRTIAFPSSVSPEVSIRKRDRQPSSSFDSRSRI